MNPKLVPTKGDSLKLPPIVNSLTESVNGENILDVSCDNPIGILGCMRINEEKLSSSLIIASRLSLEINDENRIKSLDNWIAKPLRVYWELFDWSGFIPFKRFEKPNPVLLGLNESLFSKTIPWPKDALKLPKIKWSILKERNNLISLLIGILLNDN